MGSDGIGEVQVSRPPETAKQAGFQPLSPWTCLRRLSWPDFELTLKFGLEGFEGQFD